MNQSVFFDATRGQAYIRGQWRDGATGDTFAVVDPSNGKLVKRVADTSEPDWGEALDAADRAFQEWKSVPIAERSRILSDIFHVVVSRKDELAQIISVESGKPFGESLAEVSYGASFFDWYSQLLVSQRGEIAPSPSGEYEMRVTKEPVGPTLIITPWNFPFAMLTRKLGAALAAGCTVLIKPAGQTPQTCSWLVERLAEVGIPAGVINYLPTSQASALSKFVMSDGRLKKVSFTGSTSVGKVLLKQAADHVQAASMELGGNAPFIVLPGADVKNAAEGAVTAKFRNAGQACVAANRILIHRESADDFLRDFSNRTEQLVQGPWYQDDVQIGPMADAKQLASMSEIVEDAIAEGGEVLTGGFEIEADGYYFSPTVITGCPVGGVTWSREIFGPIAAVYTYESVEEVVHIANQTEYGLVSYVYGSEGNQLLSVADSMESGMVAVNRAVISEARAPFGGVKESGMGREGGTQGLDDYQVTKYTARQY